MVLVTEISKKSLFYIIIYISINSTFQSMFHMAKKEKVSDHIST